MKNNYQERKQARLENAQRQAQKNQDKQTEYFRRADQLAGAIPFGQPILIGHHSEKRHRAHVDKIHSSMNKGVEAGRKADYYESKAAAIENNTSISSDDPEALTKLKSKLQRLQDWQQLMKDANRIFKKKHLDDDAKISALIAINIPESAGRKLLEPDFAGRIGFASYLLTNNNANMNRIQIRIKTLEKVSALVTTEEEISGIKIRLNVESNRVQIFFPMIPDENVRKQLKSRGFRWAPTEKAWQRHLSAWAHQEARTIISQFSKGG